MSISFALTPRRARGRFSGEMSAASSRANTSSKKGVMRLQSGPSSRQVVVRGFENLAQGDSTLFRPDTSVGEAPVRAPSTDELYLAAAREATRQLQEQNSLVPEGPRRPLRKGPGLFRASSARIAGLLDPYPESLSTSKHSPDALSASSEPATPPSVLTPVNWSSSETSSVCDATPERLSTETPTHPPLPPRRLVEPELAATASVAAPAASATPSPPSATPSPPSATPSPPSATPSPPSAPRAYAGEFVKLEDHDRSMAMASLALVAKNIAIDAIVVETEHLRREVVSLSPKTHEDPGSADAEREPEAKPEARPEPEPEPEREPTAETSTSSSPELDAVREENARLRAELHAERDACATLRAEREAWRAERLANAAASSAECLRGDAENVAHETLRALSLALRGEDLSYDAPATRRRAEAVARAGGVTAVLGAMAAHGDSPRVQAVGSEALRRMAESSDAARRLLLSEPEALVGGGGVPVLVGAVRAHADSEKVAGAAGGTLVTMAKNDPGKAREAIAEAGGREAILEAATKHPKVSYGDDVVEGELYGWLVSSF